MYFAFIWVILSVLCLVVSCAFNSSVNFLCLVCVCECCISTSNIPPTLCRTLWSEVCGLAKQILDAEKAMSLATSTSQSIADFLRKVSFVDSEDENRKLIIQADCQFTAEIGAEAAAWTPPKGMANTLRSLVDSGHGGSTDPQAKTEHNLAKLILEDRMSSLEQFTSQVLEAGGLAVGAVSTWLSGQWVGTDHFLKASNALNGKCAEMESLLAAIAFKQQTMIKSYPTGLEPLLRMISTSDPANADEAASVVREMTALLGVVSIDEHVSESGLSLVNGCRRALGNLTEQLRQCADDLTLKILQGDTSKERFHVSFPHPLPEMSRLYEATVAIEPLSLEDDVFSTRNLSVVSKYLPQIVTICKADMVCLTKYSPEKAEAIVNCKDPGCRSFSILCIFALVYTCALRTIQNQHLNYSKASIINRIFVFFCCCCSLAVF